MNVLAIEGALGGFSASVAIDERIVSASAIAGNVALESGLDIIAGVLKQARLSGPKLDRIAVGNGPGGFTGLRITIAFAKSLAQAWKIPLAPVSSFDILNYGQDLGAACLTIVTGRPGIVTAQYSDTAETLRASGAVAEVLARVLIRAPRHIITVNAPEDVLCACAEGGFTVDARYPSVSPPSSAAALRAFHLPAALSAHEVRADYGERPAARVPAFAKGSHTP
ncbi:MAG: tRNA (adenosine(37)-N6)-threonylcarbamoyltransferase complex dimerization subunit type 1 TsaB [Candidatus Eremiobacteraeota bacterium]|nr:tRNA (adenosine(37)-N6)-threonylcarbamoyltransferase complex dimerization subunit type 1 TsaB [Candidatus Eremiobacteraeota bacterium]